MPEFVLVGWAFAIFWFLFLLHRKGRGDVLVLQWTVLWFGGLFPLMY
jgi:hypothetical protein